MNRSHLIRTLSSTWVLGILVFVASWPVASLTPTIGIDPSWRAALHMAAHNRIGFGDDLIYSYGPLGFLNFPILYYSFTAALAAVYVAGVQLGLSVSLVWAARQTMPAVLALGFALIAASTLSEDAIVVPVLIWCVAAMLADEESLARRLLPIGGGVVAAIEVLGKLNVGATVLVLLSIAVVSLPNRKRAVPVFVVSFLVTLLAAWFVTGGSPSGLWSYGLNSGSIVSGYSGAMSYEDPAAHWWLGWAVALLIGLGAVAALRSSRHLGRPYVTAALALWAVFAFTSFKAGFVRADATHRELFFSLMLGGLFAFTWSREGSVGWRASRTSRASMTSRQVAPALSIVAAVALYFAATAARVSDVIEPGDRADHAYGQLKTMLDSGRRHSVMTDARAAMRRAYALDARSRALVGHHPVQIWPHETAAVWAYNLNWRPLPVFQTYTAYTKRLDDLDADALASADGPELVLRKPERAIDSRNGTFDSPAAVVALVCHYGELRATKSWQLLRRRANRCGPSQFIGEAKASLGENVTVPRARRQHELVVAKVRGIQVSGRERLRALLYKPRERQVAINGLPFRFIAATAEDGLLLRIPARADYSGNYGFSKNNGIGGGNADTIAFYRDRPDKSQRRGRSLTIDFYRMPIRD